MNIQHKILFGYVILMAVIGSMTAILLFDRARIREIEKESAEIRAVRLDINTVHRRITELATLGESVMAWDTTEYRVYHEKRMSIDTLLVDLKQSCTGFVLPEQVDGNWTDAMKAMNTALSGTSWQYVLGPDGLPVLEKNQ